MVPGPEIFTEGKMDFIPDDGAIGGVIECAKGKGNKKGGGKPPKGPRGENQVPGMPVEDQKNGRRNPGGGGKPR